MVKRGNMAWSDLPATAQHEMDKVLTDLRARAEEGHARAQCLLGFVIDGGRGVVQSNVEAAKWFKKAACFQVCVLPSEPRLAALRWVKASHRLEWEDRGLGAERKSVQDERENPPPNSDTCESEPEHNRLFERPREVLMHRAGETITDGRRR